MTLFLTSTVWVRFSILSYSIDPCEAHLYLIERVYISFFCGIKRNRKIVTIPIVACRCHFQCGYLDS